MRPTGGSLAVQCVQLTPVAPERLEQGVIPPQALREVGRLSFRSELGAQVEEQQIDLGRAHHRCEPCPLREWHDVGVRWIEAVLSHEAAALAFCDQLPEGRAARGVRDEMNPVGLARIHDTVAAPVVEYPGLTGRHVHRFAAAAKQYVRGGADRNVYL